MTKKSSSKPVSAHVLTALEMRISAEFFGTCAETYVDHSSNEFDLPDTPVRREIVQAAYQLWSRTKGGDPGEWSVHRRRIDAADYALFHYFAVRWGALASEVESGKAITPPLGQEELLTAGSLLELLSHNDTDEYAHASDDPDHGLPHTPDGRQLAEAAIRHTGRKDVEKRIKAALAGEYSCEIHLTVLFAYLAARCKALAEVSPVAGYPLDRIAAEVTARRAGASAEVGVAADTGKLPVIKRPGISPKWLPAWKTRIRRELEGDSKELSEWYQYFADSVAEFANNDLRNASNPLRFGKLGFYIARYANSKLLSLEREAVDLGRYDADAFAVYFASNYFATLLNHRPWVERSTMYGNAFRKAFNAALGMAIGCKEEAKLMARVLLDEHRNSGGVYPARQCVLQIFASYLGEPPIELAGEAAGHTIYKAFAAHWRHPDADALAPLLLAVCDEHTHRTTKGKPYGDEFDFFGFERTPVEILLVFKLREELGLPNPKLDHPLMNTPLGQLHKEVKLKVDDVMAHAIKRAREEGFDEKKILAALQPADRSAKRSGSAK